MSRTRDEDVHLRAQIKVLEREKKDLRKEIKELQVLLRAKDGEIALQATKLASRDTTIRDLRAWVHELRGTEEVEL